MQFRSIFLVLSVLNGCTCSPILTAMVDLIRCLHYPIQITVMQDGCWTDPEKTYFWRELASIPAAVRFSGLDVGDLPWDDPNQHRNLLVVDASCPGTKRLLQQAGQLLYYRVKWIVIDRGVLDCGRFLRFFDDLKVLISSEVYYLCAGEGVDGYSIRQVYRYSSESSLREEVYGYWYHDVVVRNDHAAIAASVRRQNLNRFKLRASVVITHNATFNHLEDYKEKHVDTITKKNYFLTKYMIENLNATVQYSYVNSWGYRNPKTGRFSGMIGELQADQADLGATALFLTADRIREIDYLSMTTPTRAKFVFRSPKLSVTDNVFILPFNGTVWMCIISFIVLSATLLLIIMLVEFRYTTVRYGSFRPTLMDTLMNMFGTSCQQGSFMEPKSLPTRCLILLSLIVLMFLYASYSANIVALIQSPSRKIRTVEDLLNSRLETGAEDTVYNKYYFMHETEPIRKALFERKMRSRDGSLDRFIPLEKGVERLRQGLYAFHVELGVGYKVISETYQEDEKCGLQEIEYLNIIDPYYAVQKNSSFREIIRLSLFKLREFGIQGREHSMLYTKKPTCSGGSSFIPVTIVDVWPALVLLWWGFGIAAGLLVGEFWLKRRRDIRGRFFKRSRFNGVKPMGLS